LSVNKRNFSYTNTISVLCLIYLNNEIVKKNPENHLKIYSINISFDTDSLIRDRFVGIKLDSVLLFEDSLSNLMQGKTVEVNLITW
jgi:hypothetical protein